MIVREDLSVAYDVLRSFALYVGIDPDDTYLGLPHSHDVSSALVYVPRGRLRVAERTDGYSAAVRASQGSDRAAW